jgi:hypothetical protein
MPDQKIHYEDLPEYQKVKLLNIALDLLAYKPSLIGDVKTGTEYLDSLEAFAKTLYERFPNFERKGSMTFAHTTGL